MEGMSKELAEVHEANKAYKKTRKVKKTKPAQECNEALEIEDNQWYSMGISLKKTLESCCKEFEQLLINILNEDFEQRAKRVLMIVAQGDTINNTIVCEIGKYII